MDQLNLIASNKSIENEIQVLQSRALMEDVVKKLFLYAPLSQKGKVKSGDAYMLSPVVVEAKNIDSIIEVENVDFDYDKNSQTILLNNKDKYPINQFVSTPYGVLKFTNNTLYRPSTDSHKQLSFSLINPNLVTVNILSGLVITSNSAFVNLSFKDIIPQRAVNILNALIDLYEIRSVEEKNTLSRSTLGFLNERLNVMGKDLDSIEKKIQQFKSGSNVYIGEQGATYLGGVADADRKLNEINTQTAVLNEMEKYVSSQAGKGSMVPSTLGISDPTISTLLNKLYTSETEYDKLKKTIGENNPRMIALADEINKIRPSILDNVKNQQASLNASRQSLYATRSTPKRT
jgi:uncharacterized protein involved in exopolysaccharide biosynthesis